MTMPVLATKLYFPPGRTSLVKRPRLVERLVNGLEGRLTLISAPAGYGKTTLLGEWRLGPGRHTPVAWLSLDAEDNDLGRFLMYLAAALDALQPGLAQEAQPLLQAPEMPNAEAVLTLLVNRLSNVDQDIILALDDYHLIENTAIQQAMSFLIEHLSRRMHLAILTRADPPFPLARLRASNQLTEIRLEHLRFSTDEAAQFLNNIMGLKLSIQDVTALERRTEGWIAGLQLAALSMHKGGDIQDFIAKFTGSHHYIVDYLVEEVLSRQPAAVRDFLVKTAILERLTGALCDAVVEGRDGAELLKQLEHDNLFVIPLDHEQRWYRYHLLFADVLRSRLGHDHPESVAGLHTRAAEWFENNGLVDEAISHALAARNFEGAARLVCSGQLEVLYTRNISTLDRWLGAIPEAVISADPWLCLAKARVLWSTGRRENLIECLTNARQALAEVVKSGRLAENDGEYRMLLGEILSFEALATIRQGDPATAVKLALQAVQTIPKTRRNRGYALGGLYLAYQMAGDVDRTVETCLEAIQSARALNHPSMHATSAYTLGAMLRIKGHLQRAEQALQDCLEYAESREEGHLFYNGLIHIALAEVMCERNDLDEMEAYVNKGLALLRQGGTTILMVNARFAQARLKFARREFQEALDTLEVMRGECQEMDADIYQGDWVATKLRYQAELGNMSGIAEWVSQIYPAVDQTLDTERFGLLQLAGRFLVMLGRIDEAIQLLERLETVTGRAGYYGWLVLVLVLLAMGWKHKGDEPRALGYLKKALELAEPEGFMQVFLNEGSPMQELLHKASRLGYKPEFARRITAAWEAHLPLKEPAHPKPAEILSKREVELLRLIAAGRSNKEIASELFISIGTVKRHTANIFNKLDVKNRTEAVRRAGELNLL